MGFYGPFWIAILQFMWKKLFKGNPLYNLWSHIFEFYLTSALPQETWILRKPLDPQYTFQCSRIFGKFY